MFRRHFTRCARVRPCHYPIAIVTARATIPRFFTTTPNRSLELTDPLEWWRRRTQKQQQTLPEPTLEDMLYIRDAMNQGDRLAGVTQRAQSSANRRALIVAPRYEDHAQIPAQGIQRMPYTVRDARLMYETLVRRDYKPGDIRILADGHPQFNGLTDPTRTNVLDSLKWLVDGTQPGDYRFFYFGGHGERLLSKKGQGKEARLVNENGKPESDDTERLAYGKEPSKWPPTESPLKQVVLENEIVYYKEAIITTLSANSYYDGTSGVNFRIEDWELNNIFARLPADSNLTCVIDCCASGRILSKLNPIDNKIYSELFSLLDNSVKVAGAGFRGTEPPSTIDKLKGSVKRGIRRVIGRSQVEMEETIPLEEREMDHISANALTWAACHQRQDSVPSPDLTSGLFTKLWTEALNEDTQRTMLIGDLYGTVSSKALELGKEKNAWQYVQLWTSMGHEDKAMTSEIMKNRVVI